MLLLVCTIKITFLNQLSSPEKPLNPLMLLICKNFYTFFREMVKYFKNLYFLPKMFNR